MKWAELAEDVNADSDNRVSMQSIKPRVDQWVVEFLQSVPGTQS
jgi:hypothetical protein